MDPTFGKIIESELSGNWNYWRIGRNRYYRRIANITGIIGICRILDNGQNKTKIYFHMRKLAAPLLEPISHFAHCKLGLPTC